MMGYPQENTVLSISTPFGADAVLLVDLHGEERISGLFRFDLELISPERSLDFTQIMGQGVTVTIKGMAGGSPRYIHGICTRFVQAGRVGKQTRYRVEVHPWLWLLGKTADSRIFQEKSTPDILKEIFQDFGFSSGEHFKDDLRNSYSPRLYCVQYQETALDFVSRLMEDEGIHYYFTHEDGKHVLVLSDTSAENPACANLEKARYVEEVSTSMDEDAITECELAREIIAGKYAATDYNFEMPSTSLLATIDAAADTKGDKLELFEYPGGHIEKDPGDARAKLRIEAEEVQAIHLSGSSHCRAFTAGHTFEMAEHDRDDANIEYLLLRTYHQASGQQYSNTFEAIPKSVPYRAPRTTPKATIQGAQTAVVVGKSGEEIWTDEYGRIKVQFHWDRKGAKDDKSSCFVRVAQFWAGKSWGALYLPRVGQEVIVSFLEGDPDRPIVTGSVYNAEQTVPYSLPGDQNKSTIMSRSTKDGDAGNELRFDDTKGSEELYQHAKKDMVLEIENDWTITVGGNESHSVTKNRTLSVDGNESTTITKNRDVTVEEGHESLTVSKGNRTIDVSKGNETHSVKGKRQVSVEGDETHQNKGKFTHQVEKDFVLQVKGKLVIQAKSVTIKSDEEMTLKSGKDLKALAAGNLTTKSDKSVTVKGSDVKIN